MKNVTSQHLYESNYRLSMQHAVLEKKEKQVHSLWAFVPAVFALVSVLPALPEIILLVMIDLTTSIVPHFSAAHSNGHRVTS